MSKISSQTFFREPWLRDPAFSSWLVAAISNTQASFNHCKKSFELFNLGAQGLKSQAVGKKHLSFMLSYFSFS